MAFLRLPKGRSHSCQALFSEEGARRAGDAHPCPLPLEGGGPERRGLARAERGFPFRPKGGFTVFPQPSLEKTESRPASEGKAHRVPTTDHRSPTTPTRHPERSEFCVFSTPTGRSYGFLNTKREMVYVSLPPFITRHPERSRRIYSAIAVYLATDSVAFLLFRQQGTRSNLLRQFLGFTAIAV